MEAHETRRKANIEAARNMLIDTKHMAAETEARVSKVRAEYEEGKKQHVRKVQKCQSMYEEYCRQLEVLQDQAEHLKSMIEPDPKALMELNKERKEELRKYEEEVEEMNVKFSKILEELEDQVKAVYGRIREERDLEMELEVELDMVLNGLKPEEKISVVNDFVERRKKVLRKRHSDREKGLRELDEAQKRAEEEIKAKEEQLSQAKRKHAELAEELKIAKIQSGNYRTLKYKDNYRPTPISPNSKET